MFGIVSKKQHEAALLSLHEEAERRERSEALALARQTALSDLGVAFNKKGQELREAQERTQAAEAACHVAEETCARVTAAHATRVRVGHIPFDPIAITARIRAIQGSLRAEWDGDKLVIYADRPLTEPEFNAVVAAIVPRFDRT